VASPTSNGRSSSFAIVTKGSVVDDLSNSKIDPNGTVKDQKLVKLFKCHENN
jgi:hypothetical protein